MENYVSMLQDTKNTKEQNKKNQNKTVGFLGICSLGFQMS